MTSVSVCYSVPTFLQYSLKLTTFLRIAIPRQLSAANPEFAYQLH